MSGSPTKVGLIGCGTISGIYLENSKKFDAFDIVRVGDVRVDAAQARAAEYGIEKSGSVEDLLADPEVEIVINLTPHRAHGMVGMQVLNAGKSVYNELVTSTVTRRTSCWRGRPAAGCAWRGTGHLLWWRVADGAQADR